MIVKRTTLLLVLAAVVAVVAFLPAVAMANNAIHGNYVMNTDACAGCHRAHTAPSSITWQDADNQTKSALLLSTATNMQDFCYLCHDNTSTGADTNVEGGYYRGTTQGTPGARLLGGLFGVPDGLGGTQDPDTFQTVTSRHMISGGSWRAWGGGVYGSTSTVDATGNAIGFLGTGDFIPMDCATCHDPHGSSNYRILKDRVYGVAVGGYDGGTLGSYDPTPTPYVWSAEAGYPVGGFRLHTAYPTYFPDYTVPQYAKPADGDPTKGMSGWCVGCHTVYMSTESTYNAGDNYGLVTRYRHAMNVPLSNFKPVSRSLIITTLPDTVPLAHGITAGTGGDERGATVNTDNDWLDCMTCHVAHGTTAVMTGYADVADATNPVPNTGGGGVPPSTDNGAGHMSSLLRLDNRSACELCHNK